MVYMASWDEFVDRSVQLFRADPDSTRYVMKYRHCDGKLVLKVTDNKEILIVLRGVVYGLECNFVKLEGYWSKLCQNNGCFLLFNVEYGFDVILFNESDWISEVVTMFVGLGCPACLKFKTDQAQEAKKMEKLNNLFFTLMSRGPEADLSEVTGKEQTEAQPGKKGRGRKQ
ncbi:hypothetical protein POTOM_009522 [Populus tomentosa]|uniref:SRP9 domain-containing protein n=1 Tax=Populus tomentosa TaxID=118781 RepID=A0A8X8DBT6_POPTO|nr:hypothetical protein POTOM_009522 [Populus tomentosa]